VKGALLALLLVLAACGHSAPATGQSGSPGISPSPGPITWPAISADDSDTFGIDISGTGPVVTKVEILSRYGLVWLGGRAVRALVYKEIPWTGYSLVLYQAIALEAHAVTVFWFYCTGRALTYVYWESTTGSTISRAPLTGNCLSAPATHAQVSWPAVSMVAPPRVHGFLINGAQLAISDSAPGQLVFDGQSWTVYPYATVDCSKACGAPGWYELHSLLWDSETGDAAYGIFYMLPGQPHTVRLDYALELPTLRRLADAYFNADWSRKP
jgi:hypothetical protein